MLVATAGWPTEAQAASFCNLVPTTTNEFLCQGTTSEYRPPEFTGDRVYTLRGAEITDRGFDITASDAGDITVFFDPTTSGGTITEATSGAEGGVIVDTNGGDLTLTAPIPAAGTFLHDIVANFTGVRLRTNSNGLVNANSYLPVTAGSDGYELEAETGAISATIGGPVAAGRHGILADTAGGDVTINVVHAAPSTVADITFNTGGSTIEGLVGGVVVRDSSGGGKGELSISAKAVIDNTITVDLGDDVTFVGMHDANFDPLDVHAGVHATSATARIGVILGNGVFVDPVDYGLHSVSGSAGVLTQLGYGNRIVVEDLDRDGLAIGLFAQSGAVDDSTPFDPTYPHAVAVVTGGGNQIDVAGNAVGTDNLLQAVAGIGAIAAPSGALDDGGLDASAVADGPSILVSLGAHDAGDGVMAGDQITVIGDGFVDSGNQLPIFGIAAALVPGEDDGGGGNPEIGPEAVALPDPNITVRSADASAVAPTHIFVGDDEDPNSDVSGDASMGIFALNQSSGDTLIELGAHTSITVVDNNDPILGTTAPIGVTGAVGILAEQGAASVANSFGIHVVAASDKDEPSGDIVIGVGADNHIDVTGGFGVCRPL